MNCVTVCLLTKCILKTAPLTLVSDCRQEIKDDFALGCGFSPPPPQFGNVSLTVYEKHKVSKLLAQLHIQGVYKL